MGVLRSRQQQSRTGKGKAPLSARIYRISSPICRNRVEDFHQFASDLEKLDLCQIDLDNVKCIFPIHVRSLKTIFKRMWIPLRHPQESRVLYLNEFLNQTINKMQTFPHTIKKQQ